MPEKVMADAMVLKSAVEQEFHQITLKVVFVFHGLHQLQEV